MSNQTFNKEIENFFDNLIENKISLTNELFLKAVEIQKKEMSEKKQAISYYLSEEDLTDYIEFLNEQRGLLFDESFDIALAQNDRAEAISEIYIN